LAKDAIPVRSTSKNENCVNRGAVIGDQGMYDTEVKPLPIFKWDNWSKWVLFLLVGYSLTARSFAYLGIPPARLFVGDITLGLFILLRPRQIFDPWIKALTKGGPLGPMAWILLISISYGIFQVIRGVLMGFSPLTAIQNLVFNVYPLYLFLGIWLGKRRPELLLRFVQIFAICFCIYAPAYYLYLNKIFVVMPGSDGVNVFGQANGGGFIILSLLCLDPKPGRWWPVMAIASAAFLAAQVRSEWLGMIVATMIWGVLSRKMTKVAMIGAGIFAVLAIGAVLDVNLPSTGERGGAISSTEIVARGLAAVSPDLARDLTGSENVNYYKGTITWRQTWWKAIWANSQDNYTYLLIGPGYGYLLKNLVTYLSVDGDLRTPHNIFYYALGYSGWIGVAIFFSLQSACAALLWRTYRVTGQAWGLAIWASGLTAAFFGNVLETPAGAIPFYLLMGLFVGPALAALGSPAREALSHLAPAYPQQDRYAPEGAYSSEAI
jgi:O-Antigen ligase